MSWKVTVHERASGHWRLTARHTRRRALYRVAHGDHADAEAAAEVWRRELRTDGSVPIAPSTPLAVLIRSMIDGAMNLQARSRDTYAMTVRTWIDPPPPATDAERRAWGDFPYDYNFGQTQLQHLTRDGAKDFHRHLQQRRLSASVVRSCIRLCRWACAEALADGVIAKNHFDGIKVTGRERIRIIPEITQLADAQTDDWPCAGREGLLIRLATATGARRNELLALTWRDIDLDRAVLRISKALEQRAEAITLKLPKTRASHRNLPLAPPLIAELRTVRAAAAEASFVSGHRLEMLPVLPDRDGVSWWSPQAATQAGRRALRRLGIEDVSLHSLRHVYATTLMTRGVHPRAVQAALGHARLSTTILNYTDSVIGDEATIRDAMIDALSGNRRLT